MLDAPNVYPKSFPCNSPHSHRQVWSTTSWQGASGLCFGGGVRPLGYPVGGGELGVGGCVVSSGKRGGCRLQRLRSNIKHVKLRKIELIALEDWGSWSVLELPVSSIASEVLGSS